jgi:hypothetical protein
MCPRVTPLPSPANEVAFHAGSLLHFPFSRASAPKLAQERPRKFISQPHIIADQRLPAFLRKSSRTPTSFLTTADFSHNTRHDFTQRDQHFPASNLTGTNRKQRTPNRTFIET